jgi:hypothetical protein
MLVTVISVPLGMLLWAQVPPNVWYHEASPLSMFLGAVVVVVVGLAVVVVGLTVVLAGLTVVVVGLTVVVVDRTRRPTVVMVFLLVIVDVVGTDVVAVVVPGDWLETSAPATPTSPASSRSPDRLAR